MRIHYIRYYKEKRLLLKPLSCLFCIILSLVQISSVLAYEREIKDVTKYLSQNINKSGKKNLAVVDFTDLQGNVTEFGRFLAEEFSVALASADRNFEVIDRTHLKVILQEHKLSSTGVIDPETARKLGKIAGVESLLTGTITPLGGNVRISVKILDTTTANLIGASTINLRMTKDMEALLGKEIDTPKVGGTDRVQAKISMDDFTFEALNCKVSGTNIYCTIRVINNAPSNRHLFIHAISYSHNSYLYDLNGNQFKAMKVQFGSESRPDHAGQMMAPNLPVIASLKFENASPQGDKVSLRVECKAGDSYIFSGQGHFNAVLRNIPLAK